MRRVTRKEWSKCVAVYSTATLLLATMVGCGRRQPGPQDATEAGYVNGLVNEVSSTVIYEDSERLVAAFVEDAAPAGVDREKYAAYTFWPAASASVSGDSATVRVNVGNREGETTDPIGEVTWTAVKQHGTWKLKDAPLP